MSDADWDADDFEPKDNVPLKKGTDKWEGEDEDDDVRDAWDAESGGEDEDKSGADSAPKAVQRKKKKKLTDIVAEKEAAEAKAAEAKRLANTPEARQAEKLRQLKLEENANFQMAKDMLGIESASLDAMVPVTEKEVEAFEKALTEKIALFSSSAHYPAFVESFVTKLCLDLSTADIKKVKINVEALHTQRMKVDREEAAREKKKAKGKSLKMDTNKDIFSGNAGGESQYDDMDDFM